MDGDLMDGFFDERIGFEQPRSHREVKIDNIARAPGTTKFAISARRWLGVGKIAIDADRRAFGPCRNT